MTSAEKEKRFILKETIPHGGSGTVCDFVAAASGLSKGNVKDAMNKGALWVRRKRGKLRRLRRATTLLGPGDRIEFYYDERLLSLKPPQAECLNDEGHYTVWYKPAGLMSQGTMFGDHCSLMRQADLFFKSSRELFLVHRLDREVAGLMLLAHSRDAAARLSEMFRKNEIVKGYRAEVLGNPGGIDQQGTIDQDLDAKPSLTEFEVEEYHEETATSTVTITIRTGRLHQIRRHFEMIGHPIVGDPKYGRGNKNRDGMKLSAVLLRFWCPYRKKEVEFQLADHRQGSEDPDKPSLPAGRSLGKTV